MSGKKQPGSLKPCDPSKPYKKQILKRSELLNLYFGRAQCYHIVQDWVKGEPAFRDLLKFADLAKDEDRSAYAVSCLTEMFVVTKRIEEVFLFFRVFPGTRRPAMIEAERQPDAGCFSTHGCGQARQGFIVLRFDHDYRGDQGFLHGS